MTALLGAEHHAGPPAGEPPYFRSCAACCQPWPCPAKKAELQAEAIEQRRQRQLQAEARRTGLMALVERGVSVWSAERTDARGEPLGGVVVEIEDQLDRETGVVERWFTALDPYGAGPVKARRIAEAEVRPEGVTATDGARITGLIVRLAAEVAALKGSYIDPFIAERIRWQYVLAGLSNLAA